MNLTPQPLFFNTENWTLTTAPFSQSGQSKAGGDNCFTACPVRKTKQQWHVKCLRWTFAVCGRLQMSAVYGWAAHDCNKCLLGNTRIVLVLQRTLSSSYLSLLTFVLRITGFQFACRARESQIQLKAESCKPQVTGFWICCCVLVTILVQAFMFVRLMCSYNYLSIYPFIYLLVHLLIYLPTYLLP